MVSVPYASATSGDVALNKIKSMLKAAGANPIGIAEDGPNIAVSFGLDGRAYRMEASATIWSANYLRKNPWNHYRRSTREEYERKWLAQGQFAICSLLRDWVKAQLAAVDGGLFDPHYAFASYLMVDKERTMAELVAQGGLKALPPADEILDAEIVG